MVCTGSPVLLGHNGGDHIHQLRQAGDLHTVRAAQQSDEHRTHQHGVLHKINILQLVGMLAPSGNLLILLVGMVPYVPFVKGEVDLFFPLVPSANPVADGGHLTDKSLHIQGAGQEGLGIPVPAAVIGMQGQIVHLISAQA